MFFFSPEGEYKHFIVVCVKWLLEPAVQQWDKESRCVPVSFPTAFVFLIAVKKAYNFFFPLSEQQAVCGAGSKLINDELEEWQNALLVLCWVC